MTRAKRVHHVGIRVSDVDRATDFYEGVLGLEQIDRPDFGFPGVWFQLGDVQVHLLGDLAADHSPDRGPSDSRKEFSPLGRHFAFEVDDYEKTLAALQERDIEVLGLGAESGQMFVQDPDGNVVELIVPGGRLGRSASRAPKRR